MISEHRLRTADGFNQRLMEAVRAARLNRPNDRLGVSQGWSSAKNFWPLEVYALIDAARRRSRLIDPRRVEVWANVTESGQAVADHDHNDGRNLISGIYYPHDSEAAIRFPDLGLRIPTCAGLLLLFSPEQIHSVEPAQSERISIAFNAY